ncbi:MAG: SUMF1/EgtB/PvdO family nonheme iron enzyme [bacterium]
MKYSIKLIGIVSFSFIILSLFQSCTEKEFNNPVDPNVKILPPTNLLLSLTTDTSATISWSDPNNFSLEQQKSIRYEIQQSTDQNTYTPVKSVQGDTTSVIIRGTFLSTNSYYFRIKAVAGINASGYADAVSGSITFSAPTNVQVTAITETRATVTWALNNPIATMVMIERSANAMIGFVLVDSATASNNSKLVTGRYSADSTYYFRIQAKSNINKSVYSAVASNQYVFSAPTNLTISSLTETQATLSWALNNPLATIVMIERSTAASSGYRAVDSVSASLTTKGIVGIYCTDSTYYFRLKTKSSINQSSYTPAVLQKLLFPAPSNLLVTSFSATSASLQWKDNSSFETGFEINSGIDSTNLSLIKTELANSTASVINSAFDIKKVYYFRVRAKSLYNISAFSSAEIAPLVPTGMVFIKGSTFTANSTPITISSFNIDQYEVTYELWTDVRNWGLTHGYTDLPSGRNGYNPIGTNNPVTEVNWYDIVKWCNARSEKDGLTPVYYTNSSQNTVYRTGQTDINNDAVKWTANGYRLPTEAEWEYAARGGIQTHGYTYSGSNTIEDVAWYNSNSPNNTHPVGQKSTNELCIYDMSGNVWEWCWDWHGSTYPSGGTMDPKGPSTTQSYRLLRGGSFDGSEYVCRVVIRSYNLPSGCNFFYGFRCVQD